ncbi:MAG: DegT/DnrJ/EryC1/StrS family aminotransferase [Lachnospiraceae bacterium]|nr:DegT/DnrJ/EryC1/StrS family aminotransferase [Lachnospiraceae bacterium]
MLAIHGGEPLKKDGFPGWPRTGEIDREMLSRAVSAMGKSNYRAQFEERFARDCGVKHCFAVANGTVSLEMILRAMEIGYGDEVILPPYTFVATLSSIIFAGATPVFADIDEGTYNLSHETLEEKITPKTRAIIAVAVAGCPPKLDELSAIAKKHGVKLIIDAAQAVGAVWNGKNICAWGDAASVSCQNSKNLTCGEGGIITTDDDGLAEKLTLILHGGKKDGCYISAAQDHNLSELQAAVLLSQYEKLEEEMYLREKNAAYLAGRLKDLPFASPADYDPRIGRHAYHLFLIRLRSEVLASRGLDRNTFLNALNAEGIPLCAGYSPLYAFPCVTAPETERIIGTKIDVTPLPNAEKAGYEEGTWLYQACLLGTRKDMDDIADAMLKVWEHADELNGK